MVNYELRRRVYDRKLCSINTKITAPTFSNDIEILDISLGGFGFKWADSSKKADQGTRIRLQLDLNHPQLDSLIVGLEVVYSTPERVGGKIVYLNFSSQVLAHYIERLD